MADITRSIEITAFLSQNYQDSFKTAGEMARKTSGQLAQLEKEEAAYRKLQELGARRAQEAAAGDAKAAEKTANEYNKLAEKMKLTGASASEIAEKLKQTTAQKDRVSELNAALSKQSEMGKTVENIRKYEAALKGAGGQSPAIKRALDEQRAKLKQLRGELGIANKHQSGFIAGLKNLKSGLMQAPGPVGQLSGNVAGLSKYLMGPAGAVAGVVALGAAAVAASKKIADLTIGVMKNGDEIAKQSRALGINAEAYQELNYAMQRGGASEAAFNSGLKTLSSRMQQAKEGNKEAIKMFKSLGVSMDDLKTMNLEEVFLKTSEGLNAIGDASEVARTSSRLFGGEGYRLAQAMAVGSDEIANLREQARKTGAVLSNDDLSKAEDGADALLDAQLSLKAVGMQIAKDVMPDIVAGLKSVAKYFQENQDVIKDVAKVAGGIFRGTMTALIGLFKGGKIAVEVFTEGIKFWRDALASGLMAVDRFVGNVKDKFNSIVEWITGIPDRVRETFDSIVGAVKKKAGEIWDWLTGIPKRIKDWAQSLVDGLIIQIIEGINGFIARIEDVPLIGELVEGKRISIPESVQARVREREMIARAQAAQNVIVNNNIDARGAVPGTAPAIQRAVDAGNNSALYAMVQQVQKMSASITYAPGLENAR